MGTRTVSTPGDDDDAGARKIVRQNPGAPFAPAQDQVDTGPLRVHR